MLINIFIKSDIVSRGILIILLIVCWFSEKSYLQILLKKYPTVRRFTSLNDLLCEKRIFQASLLLTCLLD